MLALPLLTGGACGGASSEAGEEASETGDGDGDGDGDEACEAAGSELPGARPAPEPSTDGNPAYTCSSGWATDAPTRDASWSVRLPDAANEDSFPPALRLTAHPAGGVIAYGPGIVAHYDGAGEELWNISVGTAANVIARAEAAGTVLVAVYDFNTGSSTLRRYSAAGEEIELVAVPWNAPLDASIWAIETFGDNIVLGAFDTDSQGNYEDTLLYIDPSGAELLRRSTTLFGVQNLAINDAGNVLFGASPGFVVSLDDGAVLGQLQPSSGFALSFVGVGEGFYGAVSSNSDLGIGGYSGVGTEQWLQVHDRANLFDRARFVGGGDGQLVVTGSVSTLNFSNINFFNTQPVVIAADLDGNALWQDRIDALGEAFDVVVAPGDGVYVSGIAEQAESQAVFRWLRKYEL